MPLAAFVVALAALLGSALPLAEHQGGASRPGQPQQSDRTGLIVGRVVDAHSGRGVAGAIVSLGGQGRGVAGLVPAAPVQRVMATTDGHYVFRDLPPGNYTVTARKPGYVEGAFGRRHPAGAARIARLAEGERLGNVSIAMWKHASISGTVLDEAGEPIVGIEVRAMRRTVLAGRRGFGSPASGTTDDRGVYRIAMLPPGDYVVAVVSTQVAVPASIVEEAGRSVGTSDVGPPARQSLIEAGASSAGPGSPGAIQIGKLVLTFGRTHRPLPPSAEGVLFVYPTTFFPASGSSRDAGLVSLASGEERAGTDFQLKPVPATQVSGIIAGPEGPMQGPVVRLVAAESEDFATDLEAATTVSAGDGTFTFPGVPPASYVLQVTHIPRPAGAGGAPTVIQSSSGMTIMTMSSASRGDAQVSAEPTFWARLPVEVGARPVTDITVTLRTGGRIGGTAVFDGAAKQPTQEQLANIAVVVEPADGRTLARVTPTRLDPRFRRFSTTGLPGGKYIVRSGNAPEGWTFKAAMLEGRDVSDTPLELDDVDVPNIRLTFTDRPTELTGTVRNDSGGPDADATVLVFPTEPDLWIGYGSSGRRFRSARAASTGAYALTGLPAGSYCAIAIPDEQTADWQDPKNLETLARRSTRVQIDDGQSRTQDLTTER